MHVVCLAASRQLGGAEIAMLEMMRSVRRLRPEWKLSAILPGRGPLFDACAAERVHCTVVPFPPALARAGESAIAREQPPEPAAIAARMLAAALQTPGYARRLRQSIRRCNPSLIHSHGLKAHLAGALSAGCVPLIWHLHEYVSPRPVSRRLLRPLSQRVSAIVANSRDVERDARPVFGEAARIRVVHNAVDLRRFSPEGDRLNLDDLSGLAWPANPVVRVGLVSTFGRWKGHETFLRALAILPAAVPVRGYVIGDALYDTVGSQYTRATLERIVSALGLQARVGFTGFQPADRAIRALDVVVHASTEREPFGLVIAEGMACGRAVITTALGGAGEIVEDGIDALISRAGDPGALAERIRRLVDDEPLRRQLGTRARDAAIARFDPDRLGSSLIDLYERCATDGPQRRAVAPLPIPQLSSPDTRRH
jgi:glycosyltransferase involved in cell wall biosynthesis